MSIVYQYIQWGLFSNLNKISKNLVKSNFTSDALKISFLGTFFLAAISKAEEEYNIQWIRTCPFSEFPN